MPNKSCDENPIHRAVRLLQTALGKMLLPQAFQKSTQGKLGRAMLVESF